MIVGQKIMINCESSGSKPPALLSWWRGAKRLEGAIEDIATDENRTISTLQFVPSIEDNGRVLSCRADHSVLPDSALEDSWILNVFCTYLRGGRSIYVLTLIFCIFSNSYPSVDNFIWSSHSAWSDTRRKQCFFWMPCCGKSVCRRDWLGVWESTIDTRRKWS